MAQELSLGSIGSGVMRSQRPFTPVLSVPVGSPLDTHADHDGLRRCQVFRSQRWLLIEYKYEMAGKKGNGSGPRPHTWIIQDPLGHEQHIAWHKQRAQANYRKEGWDLPFEEWQKLWEGLWDQRGRLRHEYCMVRADREQPWSKDNVEILTRREHLQISTRRQRKARKQRQ